MEKPHRVTLKLAVGPGDSRLILRLRNFFLGGTFPADLESGKAAPEALEEVFGKVGKWNVEIARKFLLSKTHYFFPPRNLSPKLRQSKKLDVAKFFIAIFSRGTC